jgi:hypothetical protein
MTTEYRYIGIFSYGDLSDRPHGLVRAWGSVEVPGGANRLNLEQREFRQGRE